MCLAVLPTPPAQALLVVTMQSLVNLPCLLQQVQFTPTVASFEFYNVRGRYGSVLHKVRLQGQWVQVQIIAV